MLLDSLLQAVLALEFFLADAPVEEDVLFVLYTMGNIKVFSLQSPVRWLLTASC